MINKLLISCLQRNKRLIIPGLGAFIRKNIDGVGIILVFVPFLNKDDGVLLSALQSWAGVEEDEAREIMIEYVDFIKKSLNERGQYIIEGIGVLKYDANGVIYLTKESDATKPDVIKQQDQPMEPIKESLKESFKEISYQEEVAEIPKVSVAAVPKPVVAEVQPPHEPRVIRQRVVTTTVEREEMSNIGDQIQTQQPPSTHQEDKNFEVGAQYFATSNKQTLADTIHERPTIGNTVVNKDKETSTDSSRDYQQDSTNSGNDRKSTINNLYGVGNNNTQQDRPGNGSGAIYGSGALRRGGYNRSSESSLRTNEANDQSDEAKFNKGVSDKPSINRPLVVPQSQKRTAHASPYGGGKPVKKDGKKDIILIIAIIAGLIALGSILYGFIWGDEISLDNEIIIEQQVTPTTPPANSDTEVTK